MSEVRSRGGRVLEKDDVVVPVASTLEGEWVDTQSKDSMEIKRNQSTSAVSVKGCTVGKRGLLGKRNVPLNEPSHFVSGFVSPHTAGVQCFRLP